jgi:uncharacterized protein YacL
MIIVLRLLFIAVSAAISGIYFLKDSVFLSLVAASVSILVSLGIVIVIEFLSHSIKPRLVIAAITGLLIGLILSALVINLFPFSIIPISAESIFIPKVIFALILSFAVLMFMVIKNEEIGIFDYIVPVKTEQAAGNISYKILDTSVIIDGRIADICDSGFIEGVLVVPTFVLNELQLIADSADSIKRNRGRRGLDILNRMQKDSSIMVKISDIDFQDTHEVDTKLVKLGKVMKAKVITNDFNLNKVAEFHGVDVLNINELSNALKPVVLPGEDMRITLIKEGKDPNQAIGYLDDGTMVVVENGRRRLNYDVDVVVTSVLQTTAGRMIFARIKDEH